MREIFNDDKFKMCNYINSLGPPTKRNPALTSQQWRRIKRAQFNYENLDEKQKPARKGKDKQADKKDMEVSQT